MKDKLNIPPFYIGETVEYITGLFMPKGTKVVVSDIWNNDCGCWHIAFNGQKRSKKYKLLFCSGCSAVVSLQGWLAKSFRSVQQQSYPLMTFSKIVEKEKEEILINN